MGIWMNDDLRFMCLFLSLVRCSLQECAFGRKSHVSRTVLLLFCWWWSIWCWYFNWTLWGFELALEFYVNISFQYSLDKYCFTVITWKAHEHSETSRNVYLHLIWVWDLPRASIFYPCSCLYHINLLIIWSFLILSKLGNTLFFVQYLFPLVFISVDNFLD